jgi:hypothetical protein
MARKIHRGFYRTKAARHERAARASSSSSDAEGHREVARGYHRLARGSGGSTVRSGLGAAFGKKRKKSRRKGKYKTGRVYKSKSRHHRTAKQKAATRKMLAANRRRRGR